MIEIRNAPLDLPLTALTGVVNADSAPIQKALAEGYLKLQRCSRCTAFRHPVAPVCAHCDAPEFSWEEAPKLGTVYSFVTYARAPLPMFQPIAPYSVACVEIASGLRLMGRWLDAEPPAIGNAAIAVAERWNDGGLSLAFRANT